MLTTKKSLNEKQNSMSSEKQIEEEDDFSMYENDFIPETNNNNNNNNNNHNNNNNNNNDNEIQEEIETNVIVNAWFGPVGTISPLHHDPYHNLFAQIVGEKFIRLSSPQNSQFVYPHKETMNENSSQVDVENADLKRFPLFSNAKFLDCIIRPGELLYIPPKVCFMCLFNFF